MRCRRRSTPSSACIQQGKAPVVSGEAGLAALETAIQITAQVHKSRERRG